jgi:hypothetical protein
MTLVLSAPTRQQNDHQHDNQRSSVAQHKTESDEHDDAGHYSYIECCREHINHIKRSLSKDDGSLVT